VADSVLQLLHNPPARPAVVWLVGAYVDRDTLAPAGESAAAAAFGEGRQPGVTRSFRLEHLLL
jgi:hypothetical protein